MNTTRTLVQLALKTAILLPKTTYIIAKQSEQSVPLLNSINKSSEFIVNLNSL